MISVGVIGYGYWGPNLVRNFEETKDTRVVLCCDLDASALSKVKARYSTVEVTTQFDDVLRNPSVDAVSIATPLATHYELARRALEAGKHVLVEKPMVPSLAEAESLIDIAAKKSLTLMVNHTFIYTGAVRKMKEIIDRDDLGELYYFDSVRINLGLVQQDVNVLWDLAPHDLAILDYLVKEKPISVCANGACHLGNGVENVAYLSVYFDSGLIAHFHNNWLAPVKLRTMIVGGSKRMILYDDMEASEKIKVYDRGVQVGNGDGRYQAMVSYRLGDMWAPKLDHTEALKVMAEEFIDCIKTGRSPRTDGTSGMNVVKILESAEMSIKKRGREVKL